MTDARLRFPIRFSKVNGVLMRVVGMSPARSSVELDGDVLRVQAGLAFQAEFPRASIRAVQRRPYVWSAYGVHGWRGRWIVNGSGHNVVSLTIDPPARARVLGVPVKLRELWVSLVEPERLQAALDGLRDAVAPRTPLNEGMTETQRPAADIVGAIAAHARLLDHLAGLTDHDAARPCLLPGWTVGHLLTHLARNADSHVRMLEGAAAGQEVEQYDGGAPARDAAIAAGADRSAAELVDDVRTASAGLERLWAVLPDHTWAGHGINAGGSRRPCALLPFHRWREVEVHQADLGLGPTWDDWSDDYVTRELPRALATIPDRLTDPAARRRWVAWLLDRAPVPATMVLDGWDAHPEHYGR